MVAIRDSSTFSQRHQVTSDQASARLAAVTLFAMLFFAIISPLLTVDLTNQAGSGNVIRQLVYLSIFVIALGASEILRYPDKLFSLPGSLLAVLLWCAISLTWASDASVATRRLLLTVIIILTVFLLTERAGYDRTVAVVRYLLPVILIANFIAVIGWPNWAIHQAATSEDPSIVGAWHGILMQKNFAGAVSAYTVMFFALDAAKLRGAIRIVLIAAAGFFLFETQSKTSAGFLIASIAAGLAFTRYNPYYRVIAVTFLAMALILALAVLGANWAIVEAPFHREDFLTGRVKIWPYLIQYWQDHWLLGSGYGSFWNVRSAQPIALYTNGWVAELTSGHNGYLDLLVQTGLPGLMLALNATVVNPIRTLAGSMSLSREKGSLIFACIVFSICHNLTETSIFDRDATVHVFLMLSIALLRIETRQKVSPALDGTA